MSPLLLMIDHKHHRGIQNAQINLKFNPSRNFKEKFMRKIITASIPIFFSRSTNFPCTFYGLMWALTVNGVM